MDKLKILIIDDNRVTREVMKDSINSLDYAKVIDMASDGNDGLEKVNNIGIGNIDVIVLDISMEHKDGFGFIKDFKKLYDRSFLKTIQVVSAFAHAEIVEMLKTQGIILPPISKEDKDDDTIKKLIERIELIYQNIYGKNTITLSSIEEYFYKQQIDPNDKNGKYLTQFIWCIIKNKFNPQVQGLRRAECFAAAANNWTYDAIEKGIRRKTKSIVPEMTVSLYIEKVLEDLGYKYI